MKRPRRLSVLAASCATVALASWVGSGLAGFGSLGIDPTGASIEVSRATSATTRPEDIDRRKAAALGEHGVSGPDIASRVALSDFHPMPQPATPSVLAGGDSD